MPVFKETELHHRNGYALKQNAGVLWREFNLVPRAHVAAVEQTVPILLFGLYAIDVEILLLIDDITKDAAIIILQRVEVMLLSKLVGSQWLNVKTQSLSFRFNLYGGRKT
jgi:hypothetical protein